MLKRLFPAWKSQRGQSFLELGISMIFLLVLIMVIIDLGWAFYTMTALRDTVQEAASYGIMCPDKERIFQRLRFSTSAPLNMQDIDAAGVSIKFLDPLNGGVEIDQATKGDVVHVSVEIQHQIIVPFLGSFIGRTTYPLKADVKETIMADKCP